MFPTEREHVNPALVAYNFQNVVLHSIICFVKTEILIERGYEYEVLGDEVSGDVQQSS